MPSGAALMQEWCFKGLQPAFLSEIDRGVFPSLRRILTCSRVGLVTAPKGVLLSGDPNSKTAVRPRRLSSTLCEGPTDRTVFSAERAFRYDHDIRRLRRV